MYCVYAHKDPLSKTICYIGSGTFRRARLMVNRSVEHLAWIKSIREKGLEPIVIILKEFNDRTTAYVFEFKAIKYFKNKNYPLLNKRSTPGWSEYTPTEEHKQRLRERFKGIKPCEEAMRKAVIALTGKVGPMKGKQHSEATKNKISMIKKGVPCKSIKAIKCSNGQVYESITIAAEKLTLCKSHIVKVLKGKRKHTKNYCFEYVTWPVKA